MATQAMIGPNGKVYDIPNEMVKQASRDGFRFATSQPNQMKGSLPASAVPQGLQGMEENPYRDAAINTATTLVSGVGTGMLHTLDTTGGLALKGLQKVGVPIPDRYVNPQETPQRKALLTPTKEEMPAYMGEQAAEFLFPETLFGKVGQASRLGRAARAGVGAGLTSYAQTGSAKTALENAGMATVGTPIIEGIGAIGKATGSYLLNNAMEMSKSVLARSSPGEYAIEKGVFSKGWNPFDWQFTKDAMRAEGGRLAGQAADLRDTVANLSGRKLSLTPAKQIASEWASRAAADNNRPLMGEAGNLYDSLNQQMLEVTGNPTLRQAASLRGAPVEDVGAAGRDFISFPRGSDTVSVTDALNARQGLGAAKPWNTNNFFTPQGTALRNEMYGALNEQIHSVPGIQPLDEAYNALRPFGKSIDNKPSLWPTMVAAGAGGASAGPIGALKAASTYLAARSAGVAYYGGRAATAVPGIGRGLMSLGFAVNDANSQTPNTNPFLHPADVNMLPTK